MKGKEKQIKVAVLDDSDFYRNILTRELENHAKTLTLKNNIRFNIVSFSDPEMFYKDLNHGWDIAFVDYFLGNGVRANSVIDKVKEECEHCKIIIVSQSKTIKTALSTITQGAHAFIHKDNKVLDEACFHMEELSKKISHKTHHFEKKKI